MTISEEMKIEMYRTMTEERKKEKKDEFIYRQYSFFSCKMLCTGYVDWTYLARVRLMIQRFRLLQNILLNKSQRYSM